MNNTFWAIFFTATFSSCAFHSGNISSGSPVDCPMKGIVSGEASTYKLFGLGGLNKNALILEAKKDLYETHFYSKKVKLTNFSVDFKTTFLLIYSSTVATVSADLYECGTPETASQESFSSPLINGYSEGDSIIYEFGRFFKGKINAISSDDKFLVSYQKSNGKMKQKKLDQKQIYKTTKHPDNIQYFGYKIGEEALIDVVILKSKEKVVKPCTIIGLNKSRLLISYLKEDGKERILSVEKELVRK